MLAAAALLLAPVLAQPATRPASPPVGHALIPDMLADPSVSEFDGKFYCYATTDGFSRGLELSGPAVVWTSDNFVDWSFKGEVIPGLGREGRRYWAPSSAVKVGNRYFIYPTIELNIYCLSADSPLGPFKPTTEGANWPQPLVPLNGPKGTKGIDAEVFVDDDGQPYLYWAQRGASKLSKDMTRLEGEVQTIQTKRGGYTEGPIFFKRKGIYYFLYTLGGHEHYQYAYVYSKTSPLGPWIGPDNDVIATSDRAANVIGPGHGGVLSRADKDQYILTYLEFGRGGTSRQLFATQLEFNDDGTIKPAKLSSTTPVVLGPRHADSDLLAHAKATASSSLPDARVKPIQDKDLDRTETFAPANAIDGSNGTRWMPAEGDRSPALILDLGGKRRVTHSDVFLVRPAAGHAYVLEASDDGAAWTRVGGADEPRLQSPQSDDLDLTARYLRIRITSGVAGVWEWHVR